MILSTPVWASTDYYVTYGFLEWGEKKKWTGNSTGQWGMRASDRRKKSKKVSGDRFGWTFLSWHLGYIGTSPKIAVLWKYIQFYYQREQKLVLKWIFGNLGRWATQKQKQVVPHSLACQFRRAYIIFQGKVSRLYIKSQISRISLVSKVACRIYVSQPSFLYVNKTFKYNSWQRCVYA